METIKDMEAKEYKKEVDYSMKGLWGVIARAQASDGPSFNWADDHVNGKEEMDMRNTVKI